MSVDWDRRVIPIWRSSSLSSALPETKPLIKRNDISRKNTIFDASQLQKSLFKWNENKTIGGAADLLNFSHIDNFKDSLTAPSEYLLNGDHHIPSTLRLVAETILRTNSPSSELIGSIYQNFDIFRAEASSIKTRLLLDPKNSIALIDLARLYAAQGQKDKANLAVIKALYLSPNHRFVVRSSARFFIHIGEPEKAAYFINKMQSLPSDPWLLATHIALDTILGKSPKFLKKSSDIIKTNNFSPLHLTELASSLATFEAFKGDLKSAKKNFGRALISPNDNSLAQALWSTKKFGLNIDVREELLLTPYTHEARYYHHIFNADFESAIVEARDWFLDEPYAGRPLKAATYISCVIGDYVSAEKFALQALKVDKSDQEVLNNLVFALAAQNKLNEAIEIIEEVVRLEKSFSGFNSAHSLANWGMIQFRLSNYTEGEKFYKFAIEQFEKDKNHFSMAQAAAFMARESLIVKNPNSERLTKEVLGILKKYPSKMASKILELTTKVEIPKDVEKLSHKINSWHYDKDKNVLMIEK